MTPKYYLVTIQRVDTVPSVPQMIATKLDGVEFVKSLVEDQLKEHQQFPDERMNRFALINSQEISADQFKWFKANGY